MPPHYWSVAGLLIDVIGAAFLSVEAIKLENLSKLRARVLEPLHHSLQPIILQVVDGEPRFSKDFWTWRSWITWLALHLAGGLLVLAPFFFTITAIFHVDWETLLQACINWLWPWARIPVVLIGGFYTLILIAALPGEVAHKLAERLSGAVVDAFSWIEKRTPSGTIGICGFCMLVLGFVGQMIGTVLSAD